MLLPLATVTMTAAHCHLAESEFDRPTAGYLNICPGALSLHPADTESQLYTMLHELLHSLVSVFDDVIGHFNIVLCSLPPGVFKRLASIFS